MKVLADIIEIALPKRVKRNEVAKFLVQWVQNSMNDKDNTSE